MLVDVLMISGDTFFVLLARLRRRTVRLAGGRGRLLVVRDGAMRMRNLVDLEALKPPEERRVSLRKVKDSWDVKGVS